MGPGRQPAQGSGSERAGAQGPVHASWSAVPGSDAVVNPAGHASPGVLADGALLPLPKDPSKIRRPAAVVSRTEVRFSSVPSKRDFGTPRFHARVIQRWANPTWPLHSAELIVKEGCAIASGLRGARERNYRLL